MSLVIDPIAVVVFAPIAALGALGYVDQELAFRIEHLFQVRSVELSAFGVFLQRTGGIVSAIVCVVIAAVLASPYAAVAVALAAAAVPIRQYRRHGRPTVA